MYSGAAEDDLPDDSEITQVLTLNREADMPRLHSLCFLQISESFSHAWGGCACRRMHGQSSVPFLRQRDLSGSNWTPSMSSSTPICRPVPHRTYHGLSRCSRGFLTQPDRFRILNDVLEDITDTYVHRQEIVDEYGMFVVKPESQYNPGMAEVEEKEYKVEFGQIYLSKPTMTEADGETCVLFPKEARLRNLTWAPFFTSVSPSLSHGAVC